VQRLSVLVVAHNAAPLVGRLLAGLERDLAALDAEVVLVDSASHDGTADRVALRHPWVRLVRSKRHLGWAAGVNLAASHARGRVLLMLRQDVLAEPEAIARGLQALERDPLVGLAGGWLEGAGGVAARQAGPLHRVSGAFAFMPRDLFDALGGLDPRFFRYYETVDLCRRVQALGLHVQHLPGVRASCQARRSGQDEVQPLALWRARSALLYRRKHHGWLAAWVANRLDRLRHALRGQCAGWFGHTARAQAAAEQRALLARAWSETLGGRVSPPQPW
jgi:GT2 family glycosyltransferase